MSLLGDIAIGLGGLAAIGGGALLAGATFGAAAPIAGGLITGGVGMVSQGIMGGMAEAETNKARAEARSIAELERQDALKENARNNELLIRGADLGDKEIAFNKKMFGEYKKDVETSKADVVRGRNQQIISNTSKTLGDVAGNINYRKKLTERY